MNHFTLEQMIIFHEALDLAINGLEFRNNKYNTSKEQMHAVIKTIDKFQTASIQLMHKIIALEKAEYKTLQERGNY